MVDSYGKRITFINANNQVKFKNLEILVSHIIEYDIKKTYFVIEEEYFTKYCEILNPPFSFFDGIDIQHGIVSIDKPNIFIQFMNWALKQKEEIVISAYSRNFWVAHDISHAIYNSSPYRIHTVDAQMEDQASQFAIDLLKHLEIENDFIGEELQEYKKQFKKRYKVDCKSLKEIS